jgi:hypothetical protein
MASGFNIASFITLNPRFENMLGFTQLEVNKLLDEFCHDYDINSNTRKQIEAVIKNNYNGYHFINCNKEAAYNSTLVMYFLNSFLDEKTIPKRLLDVNLKTDISWVRRLTASNPQNTEDNEIYHIDVSTRYTEIMQAFVNQANLENLFAGYWQQYVSQLPETIFQQVNENFYRTTFFELCSRYLSRWFLWHVERSYPQGKSEICRQI